MRWVLLFIHYSSARLSNRFGRKSFTGNGSLITERLALWSVLIFCGRNWISMHLNNLLSLSGHCRRKSVRGSIFCIMIFHLHFFIGLMYAFLDEFQAARRATTTPVPFHPMSVNKVWSKPNSGHLDLMWMHVLIH